MGASCLANPLKSIFPPCCVFLAIKLAILSLAPVFCTCFSTWRFYPHVLVISFYQKPMLQINCNLFLFSPAVRRRVPSFQQQVFSQFSKRNFSSCLSSCHSKKQQLFVILHGIRNVMISLPQHHIFFHLPYNLVSFKINISFFFKKKKKISCKNCSFFLFLTQKVNPVAPGL